MNKSKFARSRKVALSLGLLLFLNASRFSMAEPPAAATAFFSAYSKQLESRLVQQHRSPTGFLAPPVAVPGIADKALRDGKLTVERLSPADAGGLSGAMVHHWRGTTFVVGATETDFEQLLSDFNSYPQYFAPQILQARVIEQYGDHVRVWMRVQQHHVIPIVLDTTYDVDFGRLDERHGYSISRSVQIVEIRSPGAQAESPLPSSEQHGFLWRLNTYWSYEERDGGLYLQVEAISLTNSIPRGLGWMIGPYVSSIPEQSLEFTLRSTRNALRNKSARFGKGQKHE